jgi:hypothetical protein
VSGYTELRDLGVQFRPFDGPPPPAQRVYSPFDAAWVDTVDLLARELKHLGAKRIVCEIADMTESDLRNDGLPRAQARLGDQVRLSFDSTYGPLRYETGRFTQRGWNGGPGWQANVRAIALGLESLRKVDRYGITKRGEQYTGWKQLTVSTDPADAIQTLEQANAVIAQWGGLTAALKATHPDRGGDVTEFRKVQRAREILNA